MIALGIPKQRFAGGCAGISIAGRSPLHGRLQSILSDFYANTLIISVFAQETRVVPTLPSLAQTQMRLNDFWGCNPQRIQVYSL